MKTLLEGLKNGRTFSQYNSENRYMWDDTKEVINTKSIQAAVRKGHLTWDDIVIKN